MRLLLIGGSTREGSSNALVLQALHDLGEPDLETDLYDRLRELPAFTPGERSEPEPVADLLARVARADAVVFAVPEYAGGLPGAFKNLLDWTVGGGQLYGKKVAWLDVAAAGRGGGARAQLRTVLGYVGAHVVDNACVHLDVTRRDGLAGLDPSYRGQLRASVGALRASLACCDEPPVDSPERLHWPAHLAPGAVRWARVSHRYEETVAFYRDLVGLPVLEQFTGSYGEDGTLFGLPGPAVHLEVTRAHHGPPARSGRGPARQQDDLVFYLPGPAALADATRRLRAAGLLADPSPAPYWRANSGVVFRDPDGSGVVYAPWVYARDQEPAERTPSPNVSVDRNGHPSPRTRG
jgi:NAD(P)H-dependent FMN reductase/catechol 2,3-dioxygenase-like lactoylglutathione lyase family enzyme